MSVVIDTFHDEAKITTQDEGGVWRYQSYDEGRTDSGRTSSGRNPAFNLYLYIDV